MRDTNKHLRLEVHWPRSSASCEDLMDYGWMLLDVYIDLLLLRPDVVAAQLVSYCVNVLEQVCKRDRGRREALEERIIVDLCSRVRGRSQIGHAPKWNKIAGVFS